MAIRLQAMNEGNLEVVASIDSALDMTDEEYAEYQKSLDPALLKIKAGEEPTIFVMRKVLPYGVSQRVKNRQMTWDKGEVYVGTGHITEEVRAALVDVRNPASLPESDHIKFKKAGDGGALPEFMAMLDAAGITQDLYIARKLYLERAAGGSSEDLKKS